jgi:hypothetical protein
LLLFFFLSLSPIARRAPTHTHTALSACAFGLAAAADKATKDSAKDAAGDKADGAKAEEKMGTVIGIDLGTT